MMGYISIDKLKVIINNLNKHIKGIIFDDLGIMNIINYITG